MREFSDFEKEVIAYLCESKYVIRIEDLFRKFITDFSISYRYYNRYSCEIRGTSEYKRNLDERIEKTKNKLYEIFFLISILEKENYILLTTSGVTEALPLNYYREPSYGIPCDSRIVEFIGLNQFKQIFVSFELKILFKNGYKSREQLNFEKNYKQTKISIWVAIIIGLFSIGVNCWFGWIKELICYFLSCL